MFKDDTVAVNASFHMACSRHGRAVPTHGCTGSAPQPALGHTKLPRTEDSASVDIGILQRYRRLRVDDGMSCATSRRMIMLAALFMTGMRPERSLRT